MKLLLATLLLTGCVQGKAVESKDYTHRIELVTGGVCSATAVGSRTLLTAAHCVTTKPKVLVIDGTAAGVLDITLDGKDHALVSVTITFDHVAKVAATPKQGARVHWYGQPMGLEQVYGEGIVVGHKDDRYLIDGSQIWFGSSGAGLLNDQGQVVGVISGFVAKDQFKLGWAWPLAFTAEQLGAIK
ncbi:serine protease [Pseudoxanthomonas sp. CF125]|uniref:S1 family peptidase n=1 Tax=Pseudoxanthomonas sp. CF125 TaxID=1855303 RepID=UPI00087F2B4E|nr:serine protease [Pseudoxanthomonas sp. CF125]SDQ42469.1 Trypsin-like peptidase domain-containing protein [Pseudoxanthomonas sp. CF125]